MLHLGSPVHGIRRYGRIIADELGQLPGISVIEHCHDFARSGIQGITRAGRAAREFAAADVVMVPFCPDGLWSPSRSKLVQIGIVHAGTRARTVTVMHDVYSPAGHGRAAWLAMAGSAAMPDAVVVHGEHDRDVLQGIPRTDRACIIPHFIESRSRVPREAARQEFRLGSHDRVIGMIGWIHPLKNYELAVELLAALDSRFTLWFVGTALGQDEGYFRLLKDRAAELGVASRMTVTGYVSDRELGARLAALDVGLCPYHDASASGSMATLLSARTPIVANHFAYARDLQTLVPRGITTVEGLEVGRYRDAVMAMLDSRVGDDAFDTVLTQRAPRNIAEQYARVFRSVANVR